MQARLPGVEILTWAELVRRCGGLPRARRCLGDGDWQRVFRDAYVARGVPVDQRCKVQALRRVLPPDVAVAGRAALWLLGLDVLGDRLDVLAPRGRHLAARPGLRCRSALLPDSELCELDGLLVVSAARAVVDVLREEAFVEAVVVGDVVLRSGAATYGQVQASAARAFGLRGVQRARAAVPHLNGRSESPMETRLRLRLLAGGLTGLSVQYDLYGLGGHVGRGDLYVKGVVLEYDGLEERRKRPVFVKERRRQTGIAELGLELRRYTAADVYRRSPGDLVAEVHRAEVLARDRPWRVLTGPDTLRPPRLRPLPTLADRRPAELPGTIYVPYRSGSVG